MKIPSGSAARRPAMPDRNSRRDRLRIRDCCSRFFVVAGLREISLNFTVRKLLKRKNFARGFPDVRR